MIEHPELYVSWITKDSYFNLMLNCGPNYNRWMEIALSYVPREILWKYRNRLAFFGSGAMDACRIPPQMRKKREIIFIAERIFPKMGDDEATPESRYFFFVVLHEIVHAIKNHRSPALDNLTKEEAVSQEKEADDLAMTWFNRHVVVKNNTYLKPITFDEIAVAKVKNQKLMEATYEKV
jgi:hypothetical protein